MKKNLWIVVEGIPLVLDVYQGFNGQWYYIDSGCHNLLGSMDEALDNQCEIVCGMNMRQYVESKNIKVVDVYHGAGCPIINKNDIELLAKLMVEDGIVLDQDGIERRLLGITA
jgi:hypothetical protein